MACTNLAVITVITLHQFSFIIVNFSEVDYVCFDFMPRHHSVIRWRMS